MPPPSPARDETQDDSGFHSGGMSSSTSTEHEQLHQIVAGKTKKKSIMKSSKGTKRSESQPGRMNRCESIDLKKEQTKQKGGKGGAGPDHQFRTVRSKMMPGDQQAAHYGGHYPHMGPHAIYAVHPQVNPLHIHGWLRKRASRISKKLPGNKLMSPLPRCTLQARSWSGTGNCRPHLLPAVAKRATPQRWDPSLYLLPLNNVLSPGGQELPEQAGESALPWGK